MILDAGSWILDSKKATIIILASIKHQVSSIQHLALYGATVNFRDLFGSGSSGLGV